MTHKISNLSASYTLRVPKFNYAHSPFNTFNEAKIKKSNYKYNPIIFLISAASSLIRGMLTVKAEERANIIDICSHWWINDGYTRNCLEEAEYLASLTPVRLDLLLSLTRQEKREPPDEAKSEVGSRFKVRVNLMIGNNFVLFSGVNIIPKKTDFLDPKIIFCPQF